MGKILNWLTYNPNKNKQPKVFICRLISTIILIFGSYEKSFEFYKKTVLKDNKKQN